MTRGTIVTTSPIGQIAADILAPFGEVVVAADDSEEAIAALTHDAIGLVVRAGACASARLIRSSPKLKVIARPGSGYDSVDIAAATERGIPVVYTPGANARAMAEASLAMMLALCKNLAYWDSQLKQGNWHSRFESQPGDLAGRTLGIIGFGHVGQILATLVSAFEMTVIACDPYVPAEQARLLGAVLVDVDELFRTADFIAVHAALTDETRGLVNGERLKLVKPGSYLVNLARGGLIESLDVLHDALNDGTLAGVGLDVFDPEPPDVTHPIFKMPNCLTAPHALGLSRAAMDNIYRSMAEDMVAVFNGKRPRFLANPEALARR